MTIGQYLKFTDPAIVGGARAPGHEGEIEVLSWSHGFVQPTDPTRPASGAVEQATHQNFTFTKFPDSASVEMLRKCWSGRQIRRALLTCLRADGQGGRFVYLEVEFEHAIIANFSVSSGPGDLPVENVTLDYGIVTYRYHPVSGGDAEAVSHDRIARTVR